MRRRRCMRSVYDCGNCPCDTLQNHIVDAQNAGACIIVCRDMNARTAEQADYTRPADLQDFVEVPEEGAYPGADVAQRRTTRLLLLAIGEMSYWSYVVLLSY